MKKLMGVLLLILAVTGISFSQQDASAPQKFALVIGNGSYSNLSRLNNPVNDANDMASALQGLGFSVDTWQKLVQQMEGTCVQHRGSVSILRTGTMITVSASSAHCSLLPFTIHKI